MCFPGKSEQVYLATGATDMRKSIESLCVMVADHLDLDPFFGYQDSTARLFACFVLLNKM